MPRNSGYEKRYAEGYTAHTGSKDALLNPWLKMAFAHQDRYKILGGLCVDVGCGPGEIAPMVINTGLEYFGIDKNPLMVRKAQAAGLNCVVAESTRLPLDPNSARVVLMNMLIPSISNSLDLLATFDQAYRVLIPGEQVIVTSLSEKRVRRYIKKFKPDKVVQPYTFPAQFPSGELRMKAFHWSEGTIDAAMEIAGFITGGINMWCHWGKVAYEDAFIMRYGIKPRPRKKSKRITK